MEGCLRRFEGAALLALLAFQPCLAWADKVNNEWYSPLRTLSMGNAGIALNDDPDTSMFYNPAGLAHTRKTNFEFFNPELELGAGDFGLVHGNVLKLGDNASLNSIRPFLANHPNKASSMGYSLYPNFQAQNFAFGFVASGHEDAYVDSAGNLHYHSRYLLLPTMGISAGLLSGHWKIGAAVRGVDIAQQDTSTTKFSNIGYLTDPQQGFGLALDAGTQFTFPFAALPTFAFVARNIGGTSYGSPVVAIGSGTKIPPPLTKMTYDLSFSCQTRFEHSDMLLFDADYRDTLNYSKTPTLRRVNVGTEISLSRFLFLRFGERSAYWTAGFGVKGKNASLDIGSYADELDDTGLHKVQDRRIALQFGNRF